MFFKARLRISWAFLSVLSLLVFVLDQLTKYLAVVHLTGALQQLEHPTLSQRLQIFLSVPHPRAVRAVEVCQNFWHFRYVENPGAAWSLFANLEPGLRTPLLLGLHLVGMGIVLYYFYRVGLQARLIRFCLGLTLGGALGNFFDRIRLGYVIDFIDWHLYERFTWPTFNLADACISVGVMILLITSLFFGKSFYPFVVGESKP